MNNTLFFIISSIDFILKNNNFDWVRVARSHLRGLSDMFVLFVFPNRECRVVY